MRFTKVYFALANILEKMTVFSLEKNKVKRKYMRTQKLWCEN